MKLAKTFKGRTAYSWLTDARVKVERMKSGNWEIVMFSGWNGIKGQNLIGRLGLRTDGWDDNLGDVLVLETVHGMEARLLCGQRALAKLKALEKIVSQHHCDEQREADREARLAGEPYEVGQ